MSTTAEHERAGDALVERLFGSALGAMDALCVYLGDRLGLYRALADRARRRPRSRASARDERALRARVAGAAGDDRHPRGGRPGSTPNAATRCPPATTRCCSTRQPQPHGPDGAAGGRMCAADPRRARGVPNRRRVPYADYGADLHEGQARFTQPLFDNLLGERLVPRGRRTSTIASGDPPARVADVACGLGRSSIAIARALPQGHGRRDRPRSGLDRARAGAPRREAAWRTASRSTAGTPPIPSRRPLRPRDDLRGAARHVIPR